MNEEVLALRQRLQDLHESHTTGFVDDKAYAEGRAYLERQLVDAVMRAELAAHASPVAQQPIVADSRADRAAFAPSGAPSGAGRWWVAGVLLAGVAGTAWWWTQRAVVAAPAAPVAAAASAVVVAAPDAAPAAIVDAGTPAATPVGTSISGQVSLDPALLRRVAPHDTVFVYARAVDGPPMPLAVIRKQVKDLPLQFNFDDSMAMWPAAKVSAFPRVVVTARVSKSGEGQARPGDLEGHSPPVAVGASGLQIAIATVVGQ